MAFDSLKRLAVFLITALMPIIILLLLLLLKMPLIPSAIVAIFMGLICIPLGWAVTNSPFIRMNEGSSFGCFVLDSTGRIEFFDVKLSNGELIGNYNGQEVRQTYNRNFFWYLKSLIGRGTMERQGDRMVLELEASNYNKFGFKTEFPVLVWSKRLNSFISKEWLHEQENKDILLSLGWRINRQLEEYNHNASAITRFIVDLLGKKILGQNSWVVWVLIIVVVGVLVWQGYPVVMQYISGTSKAVVTQSASATSSLVPKIG